MDPGSFQISLKVFLRQGAQLLVLRDRLTQQGDLPGGRISQAEFYGDWTACVRREIVEELGPDFAFRLQEEPLFHFPHRVLSAGRDALGVAYEAAYEGGSIRLSDEHDDYAWVAACRYDPSGFLHEYLAAAVGRILDQLERMGVADETLVIFTSDNGPTSKGSAGPYRGRKGTTFEGGIRVPLIVRWPGRLRPGTVSDQVAITMDLTASILRVAGAEAPAARPLDGLDLLAHVEQSAADFPRTLYWRTRRLGSDRKAVRDGHLKYVYDRPQQGPGREYLFDLAADPGEQHNLAERRPAEFRRLKEMMERWIEEVRPER